MNAPPLDGSESQHIHEIRIAASSALCEEFITLLGLEDLGAEIAIDDFGTGYSSLSYLQRFPIATLKVDQSFVRDIRGDAGEGILVNAIVSMGRSLKLRVVAEGIETGSQLTYLKSVDCLEGQGFLFGRAVNASEFGKLLAVGRL